MAISGCQSNMAVELIAVQREPPRLQQMKAWQNRMQGKWFFGARGVLARSGTRCLASQLGYLAL